DLGIACYGHHRRTTFDAPHRTGAPMSHRNPIFRPGTLGTLLIAAVLAAGCSPKTASSLGHDVKKLGAASDRVCAQIDVAAHHISTILKAPRRAGAAKTLTGDIHQLKTLTDGLKAAGEPSGHSRQISPVVQSLQQSVNNGTAATKSLSAGRYQDAEDNLHAASRYLPPAIHHAKQANHGHCPASPTNQ
ncbi:MAG: hypothetical protein ACRDXE_00505, partial [Acidimicrobiales bacterium]